MANKLKGGGQPSFFDAPAPPLVVGPAFTVAAWRGLSAAEQREHLTHRMPEATLTRQDARKDPHHIDLAAWSWNPITGCNHGCSFCYARDTAERLLVPAGFAPTFWPGSLAAPLNSMPTDSKKRGERCIATGFLADIFGPWVPTEWIEAVLAVQRHAPQWEFLMLTRFPERLAEFDLPNNVWAGVSIDCQEHVAAAEDAFAKVKAKVRWVSVEPLIEPIQFSHLDRFDLLVIGGALPSQHTPRWLPPLTWAEALMRQADAVNCKVYLKSSLLLKELPGGPRYMVEDQAPDVFLERSRAA